MLASQHPSASRALKGLIEKYRMPARMWKHAIHNFLELLRYRLPHSLEHMLKFILLAYGMMALRKFSRSPWSECLSDLGRYRMAIENDISVQNDWRNIASSWYCRVADKTPHVGRLHHHLAILAPLRPLEVVLLLQESGREPTVYRVAGSYPDRF